MTLLKPHNNSIVESKDNSLAEVAEKEFRILLLKIMNGFKEDLNKQINKIRKSIQDLDKRVSNINEKFSKDMETKKKARNVRS
jgi:chaperonin cofactor prefoldin